MAEDKQQAQVYDQLRIVRDGRLDFLQKTVDPTTRQLEGLTWASSNERRSPFLCWHCQEATRKIWNNETAHKNHWSLVTALADRGPWEIDSEMQECIKRRARRKQECRGVGHQQEVCSKERSGHHARPGCPIYRHAQLIGTPIKDSLWWLDIGPWEPWTDTTRRGSCQPSPSDTKPNLNDTGCRTKLNLVRTATMSAMPRSRRSRLLQ